MNHIMQFEIRMTRFHLWIPEVLCKLVTHSLIKMQTYMCSRALPPLRHESNFKT